MGNDQNHEFDVSVSININPVILQNLITHGIVFSQSDYDLEDNNCTSFAVSSGNIIGFNIPLSECIGNYGIGDRGATPAAFGEYLRNMDLPNGATRNIEGGRAPQENGCNN